MITYLLTTVPLSLQPAADVDSGTVVVCVCVCVCAITDEYDKGELFPIASPKYVPGKHCQFINDYPCLYNN